MSEKQENNKKKTPGDNYVNILTVVKQNKQTKTPNQTELKKFPVETQV